MHPELIHKHLLIRATVKNPPGIHYNLCGALKQLVSDIDMKIMTGPYAAYCEHEGNRGWSGSVIIETSHIAIHCWDESNPSVIQLDVYSCRDFDLAVVESWMQQFEVIEIDAKMLDRANGFTAITPKREKHFND
jgi:S-adenosylmethionine/arginine decarboxylase-like enzyme